MSFQIGQWRGPIGCQSTLSNIGRLPVLFLRFYGGENVKLTFQHRGSGSELAPSTLQSALVLGCLMIFFALALHVPILFNGVFPLFGRYVLGLQGIFLLALSALIFLFLA